MKHYAWISQRIRWYDPHGTTILQVLTDASAITDSRCTFRLLPRLRFRQRESCTTAAGTIAFPPRASSGNGSRVRRCRCRRAATAFVLCAANSQLPGERRGSSRRGVASPGDSPVPTPRFRYAIVVLLAPRSSAAEMEADGTFYAAVSRGETASDYVSRSSVVFAKLFT